MTAVRGVKVQWEEHVCGWHLKEKIENGEWIVKNKIPWCRPDLIRQRHS